MVLGASRPGEDPSILVKFCSAGIAASIAEAATIPIDTAKVRLQIQGESAVMASIAQGVRTTHDAHYRGMLGTMVTLFKTEGMKTMYKGLIPGIHRQLCFASIRIGLYDQVKAMYGDTDVQNPKILKKIAASITTGIMAVSVAQPTEVVKIRFQADAGRYTSGTMGTYAEIARNEGMKGLWKGVFPNMARLCTVNVTELVVYDSIKGLFLRKQWMADEFPLHFVSAFGAGFVTTCVASPVDVVKTRYMNSPANTYKSGIDCAVQLFKHNGIFAYYKGFMPNFVRLGSWNIVMFVSYEQLKRLFCSFKEISQQPA
ncbi:predicted protein [Nematostella vectensis]|uniref:Uncharacterized protein n=1 Tax=Nematostella vectensis TaxID=45351 RepID=A7RF50_NEMVE|nr:mitochondrial uncoupling protein 2 [Nematostella vectensis]EDO50034.1 predicted protein [Nematostella vectensis]|eukprot:XP_001642097.1 predicted protein [Nematostella vectensis]